MSQQFPDADSAHVSDDVLASHEAMDVDSAVDEGPEDVPMNTWVTLGLFAAFVVAFGTCASTFLFR